MPQRMRKGSLTVEASLVLPLFLAAALTLVSLIPVIKNQEEIGFSVMETGRWASEAEYFYQTMERLPVAEALLLPEMIRQGLSEEGLSENSVVGGRAGVTGTECRMGEEIFLRVYHVPKPAVSLLPFHFRAAGAQAKTRGFIGDDAFPGGSMPPGGGDVPGEEEYVFVTEYGIVYHRSLTCPHLNLQIRAGTLEEISRARSADGSRYYPCEYCRPGGRSGTYYYTPDGNRYHRDYHCKALTRSIREVPLSEVGLPPCHICGGGEGG